MLHMEIIHQIPDCHTHTQPWICEESTPRCMRAITVALPTNKQNHNVQTHKCAASAVYDSTKYYEVWNKIKRYAITVTWNSNKTTNSWKCNIT